MTASEIARALGGRREGRKWRCYCPSCGGHNLMVGRGAVVPILVHCFNGCDWRDVFHKLRDQAPLRDGGVYDPEREEKRRRREEIEIERLRRGICSARDLYRCSVSSWVIEAYWRSRGLALPVPSVLRFLRHCPHRPDPRYGRRTYYPALVAPVVNVDGHQIGIHKTFLKPDGSGKWPFSDKCLQRETCGPIRGGAVRLAPYDPRRPLAIGEGIESVASAMQLFDLPGWVALSSPGIKSLELPECARDLVIAVDNDENGTGQEAALFAYEKWTGGGRSVRLLVPPNAGEDFSDILQSWGQ
jgi:putative DNA primase/helicase